MLQLDHMHEYFLSKKVLITGAAGFIGSNLVDALLAAGAEVLGVDNFLSGRKSNLEHVVSNASFSSRFTFIEADISQEAEKYLPQNYKPDLVLHFASPASPPLYQTFPVETYLVNSFGTHYLLDYLQKHSPTTRFLFASTSEVYGDPKIHPQPESYWGNVNPNGPRSCYDEAKRLGETITGIFFQKYKLDTRIVRIFNTYGPRINPADKRVVPDFIMQALRGQSMRIFGDGTQTRSYCFVDDLVEGILLYASLDSGAGLTLNLGNPEEMSVAVTAETISELVKEMYGIVAPAPEYHPLPQDDPMRRKPDISLAQDHLNWAPQITFREGVKRTIEYMKLHEE